MQHVLEGTFPQEKNLIAEIKSFIKILEKYHIEVIIPSQIKGLNQLFVRDTAFVIDDKIIICNMIKQRNQETQALHGLLKEIDPACIIRLPKDVCIEGGDVLLTEEYLFVGYANEHDFKTYTTARTNTQAIDFLYSHFPRRTIKAFALHKSDNQPKKNVLHLDCCFQPIGNDMAILYPDGFKHKEDVDFLINYYGEDQIILLNQSQMYHMCANVFSISQNVIVSEKSFVSLNHALRKKGFIVEEVAFSEIAKMEGLFRCVTLPLSRGDAP